MHEMTDYQVLDRETESRFGEDRLTNMSTHTGGTEGRREGRREGGTEGGRHSDIAENLLKKKKTKNKKQKGREEKCWVGYQVISCPQDYCSNAEERRRGDRIVR